MTRPSQTGTTRERTMARRRALFGVTTVAVGALLAALGVRRSAAPPAGTDASEVTHWNQVAATRSPRFRGRTAAPHLHSR